MHAVVIFESMFGNTRDIAEQIAAGLTGACRVDIFEVGDAPHILAPGTALVVVGGPTHAFGMSRTSTRKDAVSETEQPLVSGGSGIREWLKDAQFPDGIVAATFDTKVSRPNLPGAAGSAAARVLRHSKRATVMDHNTFWVEGMTGPLKEGEGDRARSWGAALARQVRTRAQI